MLIKFLQDMRIAYDGMHVIQQSKNDKVYVEKNLASRLITAGKAEMCREPVTDKKVKEYEDKAVKEYENKSAPKRGRPKKEEK